MEFKNIYYTENKISNQSLDIFLPDKADGKIPIFIYFHGGGLETGEKSDCPSSHFVEKNIGVVSINYRMYPHSRYPDFI